MTTPLSQLTTQLNQWKQQAKLIDQQSQTMNEAWFDSQLFNTDRRWLVPCVQETEQNLARLLKLTQNPISATAQIEHITERLFAQIEALQRVLTHALEVLKNKSTATKINRELASISKEALQQQLVKHQEWEQRLRQLVLNKQYEFDHAPARYHSTTLQALTIAKQRLARCQQAKSRIEAQLLSCHVL